MGYVLGQSGWVLGTAISLGTVVLLRDCGSRLVGCCEELQARGFSTPRTTMMIFCMPSDKFDPLTPAGVWIPFTSEA